MYQWNMDGRKVWSRTFVVKDLLVIFWKEKLICLVLLWLQWAQFSITETQQKSPININRTYMYELNPSLNPFCLRCRLEETFIVNLQFRQYSLFNSIVEMPLGERGGWERSESRYCGVETDFSDDVPSLLSFNISTGGFDYVLAPLVRVSFFLSFREISFSVLSLSNGVLLRRWTLRIGRAWWKERVRRLRFYQSLALTWSWRLLSGAVTSLVCFYLYVLLCWLWMMWFWFNG